MGDTALRAPNEPTAEHAVDGAGPHWCRVSVSAPHTQVDLSLPADVPVAELLPAVAELVDRRRPVLVRADAGAPVVRLLAPIGRPALDPDRSLAAQAVTDGALLLLIDQADTPPPPLFDDVIAAIAEDGRTHRRAWTAAHAARAGRAAIVCGALAAVAAVLLTGPGAVATAVLAATALMAAIGAALCVRLTDDADTAIALGVAAVVVGVGAGWTAVPPSPAGPAAAVTAAAACGAAAASIVGWAAECGRTVFTALATTAVVVTVTAAAATWWAIAPERIGAGVSLAALTLLAAGPRIALSVARLPLPAVPSREESVAESDTLLGDDGPPATGPDTAAGARRAADSLAGITIAAAALLVLAAPLTCGAATDALSLPGVLLTAACAVTALVRGRAHHDLVPAAALLAGGAAALVTGLLTVAVLSPGAAPACGAALALATAAGACGGIVAPRRSVSPVLRRAVEIGGSAVVACVVPLALWVFDLYSRARGL